jgi:hypothetical protein
VHIRTAQAIQDKRAATIKQFRAANPQRFTRKSTLPKIPAMAWLNKPDEDQDHQTEETAAQR